MTTDTIDFSLSTTADFVGVLGRLKLDDVGVLQLLTYDVKPRDISEPMQKITSSRPLLILWAVAFASWRVELGRLQKSQRCPMRLASFWTPSAPALNGTEVPLRELYERRTETQSSSESAAFAGNLLTIYFAASMKAGDACFPKQDANSVFLIELGESDVIVQRDKSNIHLLLGGGDKSDPKNVELYELLAAATNTNLSEWGG